MHRVLLALLCIFAFGCDGVAADDGILRTLPGIDLSAFDTLAVEQPLPPPLPIDLASDPAEFSDDLSMEQRLAELEDKYSELEQNYGKLADEHSALNNKLGQFILTGHSGSTMGIAGRIQMDYWGFPDTSPGANAFETGDPGIGPQNRLGFRRVRFGVGGEVWKTMEYNIDVEIATGNDVEFRDVYLGWRDLPFLHTLLVGNQKRPYGLDHINSSRYTVFLERPFVIEAINQDSRRFGIQSWGHSEDLAWNWRYGVFNQRLIQDEGFYASDHLQGELAGRLASTWWYDEASDGRGFGHVAVAGALANPDGAGVPGRAENEARFRTRPEARTASRWIDTGAINGADNYQVLGLENVWNLGPLHITAEYQRLWLDRNGAFDLEFDGGYVSLAYFLTGESMAWDRKTGQLARMSPFENFFLVDTPHDGIRGGWGAWQIAYRWSHADFSDADILGGVGTSHSFALNWYWTPYSRMQFEVLRGEIDDHAPVTGFTAGEYTIIGTRFNIDF